MSYGFNKNTRSEDTVVNTMPAGIRTGVFIKGLKYIAEKDGTPEGIEIELEDAEGHYMRHRYFNPANSSFDKVKAEKNFNGLMANLSRKFMGEDDVFEPREGASFREFVEGLIRHIGVRFQGVPLRVKVLLNNKDFPILPGYPPVFELASLPEAQSKLRIINSGTIKERIEKFEPTPEVDLGAASPNVEQETEAPLKF